MIRVLDSAGSMLVEWGRQQQQPLNINDGDDNDVYGVYLPNRCRPLRGWKTRPEKERQGRPNRHHSIPAPRERGLIQPFFR